MEKAFSQTQNTDCCKQKSCKQSHNKKKNVLSNKKRILISGSLKIRKSDQ